MARTTLACIYRMVAFWGSGLGLHHACLAHDGLITGIHHLSAMEWFKRLSHILVIIGIERFFFCFFSIPSLFCLFFGRKLLSCIIYFPRAEFWITTILVMGNIKRAAPTGTPSVDLGEMA